MINTFSYKALDFLSNLDDAIDYVGSRSQDDVCSLAREINSSMSVGMGPMDAFGYHFLRDGSSNNDVSLRTVMYGHVSIAVIITEEGRRDWSVIVDGGDCLDIEPVQAMAYILARFW